MSWVSVPDWAALSLDCAQRNHVRKPSASSKKTSSVSRSSKPGSPGSPSGTMSPLLTQSRGSESSMLSQLDSPVSQSPVPACASESMTRGGSGLGLRRSFAYWDRSSCSWRTCQASLLPDLDTSSVTWPKWISVSKLDCFPAAPWAPAISAIESQSWATPLAGNSKGEASNHRDLCRDAKSWPTPKACNADKGGRPRENDRGDLCAASSGWMTPMATATARDWRSGKSNQTHNARPLSEVVERCGPRDPTPTGAPSPATSGRLNSRFVEWLQGFPENWSRIEEPVSEHWETHIRHLLPLWLGECSKPA